MTSVTPITTPTAIYTTNSVTAYIFNMLDYVTHLVS